MGPRRRLATFCLVASAALLGAGCTTVSEPVPTAVVDGREYGVAVVRGIVVDSGDLTPVGTIERATDTSPFADDTVYALQDVAPDTFLMVRLKPGLGDDAGPWGEYMGLLGGGHDEDLCPYFARLAPSWCPPLAVET